MRVHPLSSAVALAFAPFASHAATITVTNTADSGAGSLRQALTDANAACATDTAPQVVFAIPGTGPFTISPAFPLPILSCPTSTFSPTVDATTQAGWGANTDPTGFNGTFGIVINGSSVSSPGCGLRYFDPGSYGGVLTARGIEVTNFTYGGSGQAVCGLVHLFGSRVTSSSTGLFIGTSTAVTTTIGSSSVADRNVIANNTVGISVAYGGRVSIVNNLIGTLDGSSPPSLAQNPGISWGGAPSGSDITSNVISGNNVGANVSSDAGLVISGNLFGTNATATAALPNALGLQGSSLNGTNITGNIFSGNTGNGVALQTVNGVSFGGNKIGLDVTGNAAIANGSDGAFVTCGSTMTISGNNFSGNVANGITIAGVDAVNFNGNRVGVAANGSPLANGDHGVLLAAGACAQYGSNGTFSGNIIQNNGVDGISLTSPLGVSNRITNNSIYGNGNKNININNTVGPLPNDAGDADGGPNNQQNYPVITLVTQSGGNTLVSWTFNSTPSSSFILEFFENPATGTPAGKVFLNSIGPATNASGNASGTTSLAGLHDFISMTATSATDDTSEFSLIVAVTPTPAVTITPPALSFGNVVVNATSPSQTSTLTSSGTANYQITTFDTAATCYGAPLCYGGPFVCSTNCATGTPYAPGNSCTITASFAPIVLGPQSSIIYICDNASGSPHTITLSGTGVVPPPVSVSPASQDFGSVPTGTFSFPIIFNFSNPGSSTVPISAPATTGPFQVVGHNCGASLTAFSSCNVNVSFAPIANGPASGTVFVTTGTTPVSANLTGTGITAPQVAFPPSLDLGAGLLGVSSLTETITLMNTGNAPLTFSSITVTAPFTLTNNCPTTLPPGASCDLVIGVPSSASGEFTGTLTIVSNGGSGTVQLAASIQPVPVALLRAGPNQIGFGDRIAGSLSPTQRVTITNQGGQPAALTGLNISPDFVVTSTNCGATLAPQAVCFADVAMRAVGFGTRLGQLVIGSNASNAPSTVNLSGTGCRPYSARGNRTGPRSNCTP